MVNRIGTVYPCGSNKRVQFKVLWGMKVYHETPEEGRRTHQPKHCEYNNKDELNSPNILTDDKGIFNEAVCWITISTI